MSTRAKEILTVSVIFILSAVVYLAKVFGWIKGIQFSSAVSVIIICLIGLSLIWVLILTIKGRLIGRRVVFLYVGIAVALPLTMSISQKIRVSPEVQQLYDAVANLTPGSRVLVSFDYDPPSAPELQPMAESFLYYCFTHDLKLVIIGLWPQGPQQANLAIERLMEQDDMKSLNLKYGEDYVNLGYQAGNEFVVQRMGGEFKSMFPTDYAGRSYEDLPLVRNIRNFSNIDYSFNLSAGYPGTQEWVQVAVDRYGLHMGAGNTAVQAPMMYTYLQAGQLDGLLGGMNGAAEFEKLVNREDKGTKYMLSQSFAHIVVVAFIIIGNVAYFRSDRKKRI